MTANEIKMLRWAVREANAWRGAEIGHTVTLDDHDACIAECNKILRRESAALKATLAQRVKRKGTRK
jgi:hypothetical protein